MLAVNVSEASKHLNTIVNNNLKTSVMMWGAPGIGKSSIVNDVAKKNDMDVIDVRLSQLAPTDLRGLPYVDDGVSRFARPNFLPEKGKGIIFLDEVNLAPPAIQNVAMQLVLDRRVGDHIVSPDWFIFSAGNRVEDRAAVSQMPAPLTNRFLHMTVECELESWKKYALTTGVAEQIISFLQFRPQLLHSFNKNAIAWPSPRTWDFASDLLKLGIPIESAVGDGAAAEFSSFVKLYSKLPEVDKVLNGDISVKMPKEPDLIYALTGSLVHRSKTADNYFNAMKWLMKSTTEDYVGVYMSDSLTMMKAKGLQGEFVKKVTKDKKAKEFISRYQELLQ